MDRGPGYRLLDRHQGYQAARARLVGQWELELAGLRLGIRVRVGIGQGAGDRASADVFRVKRRTGVFVLYYLISRVTVTVRVCQRECRLVLGSSQEYIRISAEAIGNIPGRRGSIRSERKIAVKIIE